MLFHLARFPTPIAMRVISTSVKSFLCFALYRQLASAAALTHIWTLATPTAHAIPASLPCGISDVGDTVTLVRSLRNGLLGPLADAVHMPPQVLIHPFVFYGSRTKMITKSMAHRPMLWWELQVLCVVIFLPLSMQMVCSILHIYSARYTTGPCSG